jgi:diphosphomevalonate decarboxylase
MNSVRVRALANLALVKYFGKRNLALNLPAAGSLSLTLDPLETTTELTFDISLNKDNVTLNGAPATAEFTARVSRFLDIVRKMANVEDRAQVTTYNSFPTAAGLASSASGFAALALGATRALGIKLDEQSLSALARRGSGSAARSIPGGIVLWHAGTKPDGSDSYAESIASPDDWDLRVVVGVTDPGPKAIGSTEAMEQTRLTSPYYTDWIASTESNLVAAKQAVINRDLSTLGAITEHSALSMHAAALAALPGILFWNGATVEALHLVRRLRIEDNLEAYFTCDAGPQPKILCHPKDEEHVVAALKEQPYIKQIIRCRLGIGAVVNDSKL